MQQEDYKLAIEAKSSHMFARASGVRTNTTVTEMTMEIFEAALANKLSRVLVDVRELKGRLGILDSYRIVTEVFQKIRRKGVNKAAVVDEQAAALRTWFLETVARNRGYRFRIFTSEEEALEWLES